MKLIDSNIIIYSAYSEYSYLRPLVMNSANFASAISQVEVLGFYDLLPAEKVYFESVFQVLQLIDINSAVLAKAIELRQQQKIKLADSLIAESGLIFGLDLNTRNVADFTKIQGLIVENPVL